MSQKRDNQKSKVYSSEFSASACLPRELSLSGRIPDAQRLVERVSKWSGFKEMSPRIRGAVRYNPSKSDIIYIDKKYRGRTTSLGGWTWMPVERAGKTVYRPTIQIVKAHMHDTMLILHECAHWCGGSSIQPHGPEFAYAMLRLTRQFMGEEAYSVLNDQYQKRGVEASW